MGLMEFGEIKSNRNRNNQNRSRRTIQDDDESGIYEMSVYPLEQIDEDIKNKMIKNIEKEILMDTPQRF